MWQWFRGRHEAVLGDGCKHLHYPPMLPTQTNDIEVGMPISDAVTYDVSGDTHITDAVTYEVDVGMPVSQT